MQVRNTRFDDAIKDYLAARKGEGYAKNTLNNDRVILYHAMGVIGNLLLQNINDVHIREVMADAGRTRSARTLNLNHACLRQFFAWCAETKRMPKHHNPMAGRKPPRFYVEERRRVPIGQFPLLLDSTDHPRNRMLIALAIYMLSRSIEITGIRLRDVNLEAEEIIVTVAKKSSGEVVTDNMPISEELDAELRQYLIWYSEQFPEMNPEWFLVPGITGLRFVGRNQLEGGQMIPWRRFRRPSDVINRALNSIGFATRDDDGASRHEGMHTLRRSGARALFDSLREAGYDGALRRVQSMLHHKNASMTEHYIGLDLDRVQRNESMKGRVMYPSLAAPNVVQMRPERVANG